MVKGCPIPPPRETLDWHREIVETIRPIQRTILIPFAWIPRHARFDQRWALFQGAAGERHRMVIEGIDAKGRVEVLFRAGDDSAEYDADLLYYRRVRGVWNPRKYPTGLYRAWALWYAERVFAARPELAQVRVRMEKIKIVDGVARSMGQFTFDVVQRRGARR